LNAYLVAHKARPERAEPLREIAAHYRKRAEWALAELFARAACAIPRPADTLFVDDSVYDWRARDELAVSAYYLGKLAEAFALNQALLIGGTLPAEERERIAKNLASCREQIEKSVRPPG
jgi:hypothetical protein